MEVQQHNIGGILQKIPQLVSIADCAAGVSVSQFQLHALICHLGFGDYVSFVRGEAKGWSYYDDRLIEKVSIIFCLSFAFSSWVRISMKYLL